MLRHRKNQTSRSLAPNYFKGQDESGARYLPYHLLSSINILLAVLMSNTNPATTLTLLPVDLLTFESYLSIYSLMIYSLMIFLYLTLNWDLYLSKYISFKGAEYCYGRDCLLQPTSLATTAALQCWCLSVHLRSLRTREKEVSFQLEKLTLICSQPLPWIDVVSGIIQKSVLLMLCDQILWYHHVS